MIIRFVIALLGWIFVGVLVAAVDSAQVPPDYSSIVGYCVLFVAWTVSYWIRARSGTARRWWWLGGIPEVVLVLFDRRRQRTRQRTAEFGQMQGDAFGRPEHGDR
ncbi:hypothetical protein GCM10029978_115850 [Actinoallomurus acanthiterrae]